MPEQPELHGRTHLQLQRDRDRPERRLHVVHAENRNGDKKQMSSEILKNRIDRLYADAQIMTDMIDNVTNLIENLDRDIIEGRNDDTMFRLAFDAEIVKAFQIAKAHGWHDEDRNDGECLALIHSKISEALQALRDGNPADTHCPDYSALEVELADAVIRIMDYAHARSLDIAGAIIAKMGYNQTRPMRHGGKQF